jgi:RND superfamily putative drug exporter
MMTNVISPAAWARRSAAHPKRVIAVWAAALLSSLAIVGALLSGALTTGATFTGTPESQQAKTLITDRIGIRETDTEAVIVTSALGRSASLRPTVELLASRIEALGHSVVVGVITPWSSGARPGMIASNGSSALLDVRMAGAYQDQKAHIAKLLAVTRSSESSSGEKILVSGQGSIAHDSEAAVQRDLKTGEAIGIPVALLVLLLVFGTLVSALLPVALSIVAIIVALGMTALVGQAVTLSDFVENMVTMMGLAVGIDYSLFIISRYREELAAGRDRLDAIEAAGHTASRAVLVSGITVVVALAGLLIVPTSVFFSLATGAILVVLCGIAAALTLLPASLSLLGERLDAGRVSRLAPSRLRRRTGDFWSRVAGGVMRRPVASAVVVVAVLLSAAVPALHLHVGAAGAGVNGLPSTAKSRQGFEALRRDFSIGDVAPARIPIVGDPSSAANRTAVAAVELRIAGQPMFGQPFLESGSSRRGAVLDVPINADPDSVEATTAVRRLRTYTDLPVGGTTSENVDYFNIASAYLPVVIGFVLVLSFVVLLLAFRSVVVPLLAIAMNLLSVGAAYGLLTFVTQDGHGAGLLGFEQVSAVEAWIPLFLFSVLFGLSMDYHVFLLSRIRERYTATGEIETAIRGGIASSARLITGAALIMVAVFAGFASGHLVMFQQMGFGLGVAVLIDVTLVRTVLVPALMKLLGSRNWWMPRSLDRALPAFNLEGRLETVTGGAPGGI